MSETRVYIPFIQVSYERPTAGHPNSLLVFTGDAYLTHWHGIAETDVDICDDRTANAPHSGSEIPRADRRISLTIRRVLKILDEDKQLQTAEQSVDRMRKKQWWLQGRSEDNVAD